MFTEKKIGGRAEDVKVLFWSDKDGEAWKKTKEEIHECRL